MTASLGRQGPAGPTGPTGPTSVSDSATLTVSVKAAPYNAKGDGKLVTDAGITNGQATLTSVTAAFTSADNGKSILVTGAGAAGADLVTTISSVTTGVATLAATAGTTVTNAYTVYGTDDTAALEAAYDATILAGGGRVVHPDGIYIVAGTSASTTFGGVNFRSQIRLRQISLLAECVDLELVGGMAQGRLPGYGVSTTPVKHGAIIQSLLVGAAVDGSARVPSCIAGPANAAAGFTNLNLVVRNMGFRAPRNPCVAMLNCALVGQHIIEDCFFDVLSDQESPTMPTHPTGVALWMGGTNNSAMTRANRVAIFGYYVGLNQGEHADADQVLCDNCFVAFGLTPSNHGSYYKRVLAQWCPYVLAYVDMTTGPTTLPAKTFLDIGYLDIEDADGAHQFSAFVPVAHLNDPGGGATPGNLYGRIHYHRVLQNSGPVLTAWIQNGAAHVIVVGDTDPPAWNYIGQGGQPAFQNSWANLSSSFSPLLAFRKDSSGRVWFSGACTGGTTGTVVFTLPVGYRPIGPNHSIGTSAVGPANAQIACGLLVDTSGNVTVYFGTAGYQPQLDGLCFDPIA